MRTQAKTREEYFIVAGEREATLREMDIKELIQKYLSQGKVMQLATSAEGQPWVCTVYYVIDDQLNIYWLSLPSRRHSQEIATNNKVAVTIMVKSDQPVVGVQAEGTAELISEPSEIEKISKLYVAKHEAGKDFYQNFLKGKNQHSMYKLTPQKFVLFDELNFPGGDSREWYT